MSRESNVNNHIFCVTLMSGWDFPDKHLIFVFLEYYLILACIYGTLLISIFLRILSPFACIYYSLLISIF